MSMLTLRDAIKTELDTRLGLVTGTLDTGRLSISEGFATAIYADGNIINAPPNAATATLLGIVKISGTPTDPANPVAYVKEQTDTLLSVKANLAGGAAFTGGLLSAAAGFTLSGGTLTLPANSVTNTFINSLAWSKLTGTPTTVAGYGITDFNSLGDARWSLLAHTHTFASLTAKPTTLSGFGITDALSTAGGQTLGGTLNVTGALVGAAYIQSSLQGNNQFVLNSVGANFGFISNPSTGVWSLAWGPTATTLGTAALTWNASGNVAVTGTLTVGGNTALHAGNYNSFAPTLTGGGASGTWAINIGGNAATLTGWTVQVTRFTQDANGLLTSGIYNAESLPSNWPSASSYAHMIVAMSNDTGLQIVGGYLDDQLWFRGWGSSGGVFTTWRKVWHDGNLPSASVSGVASTLVQRDGNGYIFSPYINTTDDTDGTGLGKILGKDGADNFHRSYSAQTVANFLGTTSAIFPNVYNNGWFRNYSSTGLYNETYNNHWYAENNSYWVHAGTSGVSGAILMRDGYAGTVKGYVGYWNSIGFGLLNESGEWALRVSYGGGAVPAVLFPGTVTTSGDSFAAAFFTTSARKFKENIREFRDAFSVSALDLLDQVNVVAFNYKADKRKALKVAFIADDTPELFAGAAHDVMDHANTLGVLIRAAQELRTRSDAQAREIARLKQLVGA